MWPAKKAGPCSFGDRRGDALRDSVPFRTGGAYAFPDRRSSRKDARTGGDIRLPEQVEDKAFISERLALLLFGTADAVGKKVYQSDEPLEVTRLLGADAGPAGAPTG